MFRTHWLSNELGLTHSRRDRRRQAARPRRSVLLTLESLEDRVVPADLVTTTANNVSAFYSPNQQSVTVTATVADKTNPNTTVGKGVVSFIIPSEEAFQGDVVNGKAQTTVSLAAGSFSHGPYPIDVSYSDSSGTFTDGGDKAGTLTIVPAKVTTTADNDSIIYSTNTQRVLLSATVADASIPSDTVNKGTVTFSFANIAGPDVKGTVTNGSASALFTVPAGETVGNYALAVSYTDSSGDFTDGGDTNGTLTIDPAPVTTTAANVSVTFRPAPKQLAVTLTATLTDNDFPADMVNSGAVTFTVVDAASRNAVGNPVTGNVKTVLMKGIPTATASANILLPPGQAAGTYTIIVSYSDSKGNFTEGGENDGTLTINAAAAAPKGKKVNAIFNPNAQTVTVSATVPDVSNPGDTVNEGAVTFTVAGIGAVQGSVLNSTATANLVIPGGEQVGTYAIDVAYSDSSGGFVDGGDTDATLTITPSPPPPPPPPPPSPPPFTTIPITIPTAAGPVTFPLVVPSATLVTEMINEVEGIILDTAALLSQNDPAALAYLNSLSMQLLGQPLPSRNNLLPNIETLLF